MNHLKFSHVCLVLVDWNSQQLAESKRYHFKTNILRPNQLINSLLINERMTCIVCSSVQYFKQCLKKIPLALKEKYLNFLNWIKCKY